MQPLNVVVFEPYKHYHSKAVDCSDFNKTKFLAAITSIQTKTFRSSTIRSAFRQTGLIPYCPEQVLEKLQEFEPLSTPQETVPISEPSPTNPPLPRTPQTIRTLQQ